MVSPKPPADVREERKKIVSQRWQWGDPWKNGVYVTRALMMTVIG